MRKLVMTICLLGLFVVPGKAMAGECKFVMSGYCLPQIAQETLKAIPQIKDLKLPSEQKDILIAGNDYLKFYDSLWDKMIEKKIATPEEKQRAFDTATKSGGEKIGGINLVVLAAQTLEHLSARGVVEVSDAQSILDSSKKK